MLDGKYRDILITNDDLTLDPGGQPHDVVDRASIAQDLVHMIRETGLLVELVANRDPRTKALNLVEITLRVDEDERIVPGTTRIEEPESGLYYLTATTREFGDLTLTFSGGVAA